MIAWRRNDALDAAQQTSAAVVSGALSDSAPTRRLAAANDSLPVVAAVAAVTRALGRRPRPPTAGASRRSRASRPSA